MTSVLATAILALSPQVYLELADPNGPAASDSSGNGHAGTYNGVPQFGLDGVPGAGGSTAVGMNPQSVPAPHNVAVPAGFMDFTSFTAMIFARVYLSPPPAASEVMMSSTPNTTTGWYLQNPTGAANPAFGLRRASTIDSIISAPGGVATLIRQWVQYAVSFDNPTNTQSLYVNGRLAVSATGITRGTVSAVAGRLGDLGPLTPDLQPFTADLCQFAIWNSALSLAQINSVYVAAATVPTTGSPGQNVTTDLTTALSDLAAIKTELDQVLAAVRRTAP